MKKLLLTLTAICLLSGVATATANQTKTESAQERGTGARTPQRGPEMTFTKGMNTNLGTLTSRTKSYKHKFSFKNSGNEPLVITSTQVSCSCVKVSYPIKPIAAGATGIIEVTYKPEKTDKGRITKAIRINTNAQKEPYTISIQADIK